MVSLQNVHELFTTKFLKPIDKSRHICYIIYSKGDNSKKGNDAMKKSQYKKTTIHVAQAYTYVKPLKRYAHKTTRQSLKKFDKE